MLDTGGLAVAILSFRHRGLQRLFEQGDRSGVPPALARKLLDMLMAIDTAKAIDELGVFPGWRLHPLTGNLKGHWSLSVTGNRRLIFRFQRGNVVELDLLDYH